MSDLVGTCPKTFWLLWLQEGDAAGEPYTGEEWAWWTNSRFEISRGERFYIVAHGRLRGWAPVTGVIRGAIIRRGAAVACTINEPIQGFRGLRKRWWNRVEERPFPDWKIP